MAATRLSISIPDDLAERLEPMRDRMNISKVCAEAIAKELAVLTDLPRQAQELSQLITRLRSEKDDGRPEDYHTGFEAGLRYSRDDAHYEDFVRIGLEWPSLKDQDPHLPLHGVLPKDERHHLKDLKREEYIRNERAYCEGWLDAMLSTWEIVKDKI